MISAFQTLGGLMLQEQEARMRQQRIDVDRLRGLREKQSNLDYWDLNRQLLSNNMIEDHEQKIFRCVGLPKNFRVNEMKLGTLQKLRNEIDIWIEGVLDV